MNSEKHKKDLLQQWLQGEEALEPTRQRNSHLLASYVKIPRASSGKSTGSSFPAGSSQPVPLDNTAMREPGRSGIPDQAQPQKASWDHLQKLKHLGRMRASFEYRTNQRPPAKSFPQAKPAGKTPMNRKPAPARKPSPQAKPR